jgi:hypothetical protein
MTSVIRKFHPQLLVPDQDEPLDYFSWNIERGQSFHDYVRRFPGIEAVPETEWQNGICGENYQDGRPFIRIDASDYLTHPLAASRAHKILPNTNVLVVLRDPISRFVDSVNAKWQTQICGARANEIPDCFNLLIHDRHSHMELVKEWYAMVNSEIDRDVEWLVPCYNRSLSANQLDSCLGLISMDKDTRSHRLSQSHMYGSFYVDQVRRWVRKYGRNRVKIWSSETFQLKKAFHLGELVSWFGLNNTLVDTHAVEIPGQARHMIAPLPSAVRGRLTKIFAVQNSRLYRYLQENGYTDVVKQLQATFDK